MRTLRDLVFHPNPNAALREETIRHLARVVEVVDPVASERIEEVEKIASESPRRFSEVMGEYIGWVNMGFGHEDSANGCRAVTALYVADWRMVDIPLAYREDPRKMAELAAEVAGQRQRSRTKVRG